MHRLDAQYILDNGAIDYKRVISERSYEDGPFVTYDSAAPIYELLRGELPWNEPVLCSAPASDLGLDVPPPGTTITEIAEHVGIRLRNSGWVPILLLRSPRCCCAPQTVDSNRCARSPPLSILLMLICNLLPSPFPFLKYKKKKLSIPCHNLTGRG